MKKFTITNGVLTAGMLLISFAVLGSLTFDVSSPKKSVLSDTTANINMYVIDGNKTLTEMPYAENGYPSFNGGAAAFKIELNPVAPTGSKVTLTTTEDCVLFSDITGGGVYGQTKTDDINALYLLAVGAVDDTKYEGDHLCKVTAVFSSSNADINGQKRSITFNIKDNDPKPTTETDTKKVIETPKETGNEDIKLVEEPAFKFVDKNGNEVKNGSSKPIFEDTEPIIMSGKVVANAVIKLFIFSEPQEASVVADDDGNWSYTIEKIEPGEHRVEAEITDPLTGLTSERTQVLAFEVAQTQQDLEVEPTDVGLLTESEDESPIGLYIAVGTSILLLILGIIGLIIYKKKHPHNENDYTSETINPSDGMGSNL